MSTLANFFQGQIANLELQPIPLDKPASLDELPTPALVIDLEAYERNLQKMQSHVNEHGLGLRCHTKMHKSPIIAKQQLALGATGVCCAKVGEAEVMAAAGIQDILLTSPVVTEDKLQRVAAIARQIDHLMIVVDHQEGAKRLNDLAGDQQIAVLVDLDPGMARTGITPGEPALDLVRFIHEHCPALSFRGLQMYIGNCMHIQGFAARKEKYEKLLAKGIETRQLLIDNGFDVEIFSGGGTGTYDIEPELGALTEIQAGSYAFMDIEYRDIGSKSGGIFADFEQSLFVLTTAISQPNERFITMDAGIKCLATDTAYVEFRQLEGVRYHFGGDEHGIVQLDNPSQTVALGDRFELIPPHCDPTVNLYDYYYPHRNGVIEEIWPVSARGRSQ
ncbi:MAG: DSD1 family PLP-dependent enzyme [Pseudomonadales bacterium]